MIYVFKKNRRWKELIVYSLVFAFVYALMIGPVFSRMDIKQWCLEPGNAPGFS